MKVRLELRIYLEKKGWVSKSIKGIIDTSHIKHEIKQLKKIYGLQGRTYEIFIIAESKLNQGRE